MNRRRFLEMLGLATVGGVVAYSFPDIIVPKNIIIPPPINPSLLLKISDNPEFGFGFSGFKEIYPHDIDKEFFIESPYLAYMRNTKIALSQNVIDEIPASEDDLVFFIDSEEMKLVPRVPSGVQKLFGVHSE